MKSRLKYCSFQAKLEEKIEKISHGMRKVPFLWSEITPPEKTAIKNNEERVRFQKMNLCMMTSSFRLMLREVP